MAEFVEARRERFIPYLEKIKLFNLMDKYEIQMYKKIRESHEYKLRDRSHLLQNYAKYILEERNMSQLIEERLKTRKMKHKRIVRTAMNAHIKLIYAEAVSKYPNELEIMMDYINYLRTINDSEEIPKQYDRLIRFHGNNDTIWLHAIIWEMKNRPKNMHRIKTLFLRGQQRHPECLNLYMSMINYTIQNKSTNYDEQVKTIIDTAHRNINDIDGLIQIFNNIMTQFKDKTIDVEPLLIYILTKIVTEYPNKDIINNALLQLELYDYHIIKKKLDNGKCAIDIIKSSNLSHSDRLNISKDTLENAIDETITSKSIKLE